MKNHENSMLKQIFTITILICITSCSTPEKIIYINNNKIDSTIPKDLKIYPQKSYSYTQNIPKLPDEQKTKLYNEFLNLYFAPWQMEEMLITAYEASWGNTYAYKKVFAENYRRISKQWFEDIIKLSNLDNFDSIQKKAITIRNSNLRVLPSNKPIFKDYTQAGEGFPFDYNQQSSINLNTPLFISHYSTDKAWAYVSASFVDGWIMLKDIALVDDELIKKFRDNDQYYVATTDNFPIYHNGVFKDYVKLGTIFPLTQNKLNTITKDHQGKAYLSSIDQNQHIQKFPIEFNKQNIDKLINELIDKPYGWGGLYGNRDCSLLTKDLLTPFGFPMKRNSGAQTTNGKYISLKNKTDEEKKEFIKQKAIPLLSLIYIQGHIALYLGIFNNEPTIFHSTWGIKTLNGTEEGRHIIGKSVISSLELGKDLKTYNPKKSYLRRTRGIVVLSN
jgi:cell wall-associated NlpC family hydrolase